MLNLYVHGDKKRENMPPLSPPPSLDLPMVLSVFATHGIVYLCLVYLSLFYLYVFDYIWVIFIFCETTASFYVKVQLDCGHLVCLLNLCTYCTVHLIYIYTSASKGLLVFNTNINHENQAYLFVIPESPFSMVILPRYILVGLIGDWAHFVNDLFAVIAYKWRGMTRIRSGHA